MPSERPKSAKPDSTKNPLTNADVNETVDILDSETVYQGYFRMDLYRLRHRKHDGGWTGTMTREVFERGHVVAVILYDPPRDRVVLLNQFRVAALAAGKSGWQTEIAAGIIEEGEAPDAVAHRETLEESGCRLTALIPLYHYLVSPGGTTETMRLYCGIVDSGDAGGIHGLDAEDEDIKVETLPFCEAWAMVEDGRIDNAPAIMGLQWLALNRERLRRDGEAG